MPIALSFAASFPALHSIPFEDKEAARVSLLGWRDIVGSELKIGTDRYPPVWPNEDGIFEYWCLLHPNSLAGDTLRIEIEARIDGQDPLLQVLFGANADIGMIPTIPMPLEDDWKLFQFTIARPVSGIAMGNHLDMFTYSARDYEVRTFKVIDLGKKGDVNKDAVVNVQDLIVVSENYAQQGSLNIEDGDTNLDGVVNAEDVLNVINGIE